MKPIGPEGGVCSFCKQWHPAAEFYNGRGNRFRGGYCQPCDAAHQREHNKQTGDRILARIGIRGIMPEWKIRRIEAINAVAAQILQAREVKCS